MNITDADHRELLKRLDEAHGAQLALGLDKHKLEKERDELRAKVAALEEELSGLHADKLILWRDKETLATENVRLRELVKRARAMIDVSPEDSPATWPSADEINQLVKDCDGILGVCDYHKPLDIPANSAMSDGRQAQ